MWLLSSISWLDFLAAQWLEGFVALCHCNAHPAALLLVALAKRRNRRACLERLQGHLLGLQKKIEAQRFLCQLHEPLGKQYWTLSMLKTVDPQAKACLAASGFGAAGAQGLNLTGRVPRFHRSQVKEVQKQRAIKRIFCVCRRFAEQQQLVARQQQKVFDDALELWQSVLETFKERSQFAPDLLYNRASLKIASMWRGVKGRQEMRRRRLERSAQKACDCLRGFLQCYNAREMLQVRRAESNRSDNRLLLCASLRTLKIRMFFRHKVEEARKQAAMEVLSRYVKGIYLRTGRVFDWEAYSRRTGRRITDDIRRKMLDDREEVELVQRVRAHTKRVRIEIEDERQQICNMAALQLQRSWRARQARLQQLLPRLAARLGAERHLLIEMQRQEIQGSSFGGQCGLRPIHVMT
eukprot:g7166.t2